MSANSKAMGKRPGGLSDRASDVVLVVLSVAILLGYKGRVGRMNFYMSASPGRTDSKENWIFKTLFTHIPRFGSGFKTQVEKHLNIMIKKYYFTPTTKQINRMVNRKVGMNGKKYEEVLMYADPSQRKSFETALRLMVQWAKKQCKPGNKIMILGQSVNFLSYIKEVIEIPCSIYYGGMKKKEKEAALLDDTIVAT